MKKILLMSIVLITVVVFAGCNIRNEFQKDEQNIHVISESTNRTEQQEAIK